MGRLEEKITQVINAGQYSLMIHAEFLPEACLLELMEYAYFPVDVCGCGRIFIKRRSDRVYCTRCKSHRPRKDSDLRREKKRVYNRLNSLWRAQPECAKKVDDKTRAKIGEAETVDEVKAGSVWLEKQVSKDKKGDA